MNKQFGAFTVDIDFSFVVKLLLVGHERLAGLFVADIYMMQLAHLQFFL